MQQSELIDKEISKLKEKIEALEGEKEILLQKESLSNFLKEQGTSIKLLVGQMNKDELVSKCHTMKINDLFELVRVNLGYEIQAPMEVGVLYISEALCAIDMLQNDERFSRYLRN
jgi:hypothetical protein